MKPSPFNYFNADTIQKALDALSNNENAKILAGGQSLVPMMNFRLAQPDLLIDISNINELTKINEDIEYIGLVVSFRSFSSVFSFLSVFSSSISLPG